MPGPLEEAADDERLPALWAVERVLSAISERDQQEIVRLVVGPLREKLLAGDREPGTVPELVARAGRLSIMAHPMTVISGDSAIILFAVGGSAARAPILMVAGLIRQLDPERERWVVFDLAERTTGTGDLDRGSLGASLGDLSGVPAESNEQLLAMIQAHGAHPDHIDWDDPRFVLRSAADSSHGQDLTVADVLIDLEQFDEEGLRVVAHAGHTWLSLYLRARRPDLLLRR